MSVPSEEPSPEGKRFREELEKSARFGTTVAGLGDSGDRHLDKSWEGNTDQKRLLHQSEKKQYPPVTMETASTGKSPAEGPDENKAAALETRARRTVGSGFSMLMGEITQTLQGATFQRGSEAG